MYSEMFKHSSYLTSARNALSETINVRNILPNSPVQFYIRPYNAVGPGDLYGFGGMSTIVSYSGNTKSSLDGNIDEEYALLGGTSSTPFVSKGDWNPNVRYLSVNVEAQTLSLMQRGSQVC
jgi:hypothetical protein